VKAATNKSPIQVLFIKKKSKTKTKKRIKKNKTPAHATISW